MPCTKLSKETLRSLFTPIKGRKIGRIFSQ